jgi:hypothetical protein
MVAQEAGLLLAAATIDFRGICGAFYKTVTSPAVVQPDRF